MKTKFLEDLEDWKNEIRIIRHKLQEAGPGVWVRFFSLTGTVVVLFFLIKALISGAGLILPHSGDFLSSMSGVATRVNTFDETAQMEDFNSPLRHPEHIVLLGKQVANIKPSATSTSKPMVAFEIFVEAGSKE